MIIVTGSRGGIGSAIVKAFDEQGDKVFGIDRHNCNLKHEAETRELLKGISGVECLVNCTGLQVLHGRIYFWSTYCQCIRQAVWLLKI